MFRGAALFLCQDLPTFEELKTKIKNGKVPNKIVDKNNDRERDLPSRIRDITSKQGKIIGVVEYFFQARVSKQIKFSDIYSTHAFILYPNKNVLAILGTSVNATSVKNILTKLIDKSQSRVQYFTNFEISPEAMFKIAKKIRNSSTKNWCDRTRMSHMAQRYQEHTFTDYSDGRGNCVMDNSRFQIEFDNCTGFSPIIKYFKCPNLDPDLSSKPKTMKFKHEGEISTSRSYNFEHWDYFLFNLIIPIVNRQ